MRISNLNTQFKALISSIILLGLAACGGQPKLKENQAVVQSPEPVVAQNEHVEVVWRAASTGTKSGAALFEPRVEGDTIYTSSRSGHIQGFSLETGEKVLSVSLGKKNLVSGVGVNVNTIVAVTSDAEVIALDRIDGSEKWRANIDSSISAAPALNDQLVVIRTIDGKVIGLNAITGEQVWGIERPVASLSMGQDAPGLVASEGVINGFSSGRILASNVYNGSPFWERRAFRPGGKNEIERLIDIDAPPIMAGPMVIVGAYRGGMVAYNLRDGAEAWRNDGASTRKPIAKSNLLLAVTGPESEVMVLAQDTGQTRWKKNQLRGHGLSGPLILNDSVVVGSLDGVLYFLDLFDGTIKSKYQAGSAAITALRKIDQGVLVYSAGSGSLSLVRP